MKSLVFAIQPDLPPALAVLPSLEVMVSAKPGDSHRALTDLWIRLTEPWERHLRFGHDSVRWRGEVGKTGAAHDRSIATAFTAITERPSPSPPPVDWSFCTFGDAATPDDLPAVSATCSIGWASAAGERGLSLRLTGSPVPETWSLLERIAHDIASSAAPIWRWMTIGHRFVPVSYLSAHFLDALTLIHQRSKRFLGVDVGDLFGFYLSKMAGRLRTVSFVTVLAPALLEGFEVVAPDSSGDSLVTTPVAGSLFVRAGTGASVLDVNRCEPRDAYQAADTLCTSLRASGGINFFAPWDEKSTAQWLNRLQSRGAEKQR